jgi:TatD DNase family protein
MIDTHAHVHARAFARDRAEVLSRAFASGVGKILEVNIDAAGFPEARALAESDPRIYLTCGIHPHDTVRSEIADLESLAGQLGHPRVRAVGETGLDYFRDYAPHDRQRDFFRRHVALARETGLPLVVHARERADGPSAHDDIVSILEEEGAGKVRGVFHCFSGDRGIARRVVGLGFVLGIGGAVTYSPRRSGPLLADIAAACGPEVFVLETDCPYLTPHPRRRERNEPANIPVIAAALAAYLGMNVDEVERLTDATAERLFGLGPGL